MSERKIQLSPCDQAHASDLKKALKTGHYRIKVEDNDIYLWVTPSNEKKIDEKQSHSPVTMEQVEKLARELDVPLTKRIYRKPEDRPNPKLRGDAEPNRLKKRANVRFSPEVLTLIKESAAEEGLTQEEFLLDAINMKLNRSPK